MLPSWGRVPAVRKEPEGSRADYPLTGAMLDGLMGLREHITGSRAHCAADGSTAPDATTGERGDGGAAGRADGATAEGPLLGFIHARAAGEPVAQDQDCGKRTP